MWAIILYFTLLRKHNKPTPDSDIVTIPTKRRTLLYVMLKKHTIVFESSTDVSYYKRKVHWKAMCVMFIVKTRAIAAKI